ncbi:MAG: hypothetical protein ABI808_05725 [Pseudonocardiales bacterium]
MSPTATTTVPPAADELVLDDAAAVETGAVSDPEEPDPEGNDFEVAEEEAGSAGAGCVDVVVHPATNAAKPAAQTAIRLRVRAVVCVIASDSRRAVRARATFTVTNIMTIVLAEVDMPIDTTIAGMLRRHGVAADEERIAAAIEAAFSDLLTPPYAADLSDVDRAALAEGGLDFSVSDDEYVASVERATGQYAALIATAIPVTDTAARLHVTRARAQQMITKGELWAIRVDGRWQLPAMQFDQDGRIPGLPGVLAAMRANSRHPLIVRAFLTTRQPELHVDDEPGTPIDWLAHGGDPESVLALAAGLDILG